jgi:putative DNA primase/helicase
MVALVSSSKVVGMWSERLARAGRDDKPVDCWQNVVTILQGHPEWQQALGADTFAKQIEVRTSTPCGHVPGAVWSDQDHFKLGLWLRAQCGLLIKNPKTIEHAVGYVALENPFHPVQEFFDDLQWDGKERWLTWLPTFLGTPMDAYHMLVGQMFLVALVQRVYEPGCIMRAVPVLEGEQNIGKSTAVRILGQPWNADTPFHIGNKDTYQLLHGQLIYEINELQAFTRSEAAQVKAFVSSPEDYFRAPYDRGPKKHKRHTVFIATTNASQYLKDWTGNTRFWPVRCSAKIDLHGLERDRDQLLAEAVVRYRMGEKTFPQSDYERKLFGVQQDERVQGHPWEDLIGRYLHETIDNAVTVAEILVDVCKVEPGRMNLNGQDAQRVGEILQRIGWMRRRSSKPGRPWEYIRPSAVKPAAEREPGSDDEDIPL